MADQAQFAWITLMDLGYLSSGYHGRLPARKGGRDTYAHGSPQPATRRGTRHLLGELCRS
jgi:hypothetical protein